MYALLLLKHTCSTPAETIDSRTPLNAHNYHVLAFPLGPWKTTLSAHDEYLQQCRWRRACMTKTLFWPPCSRQPRLRKGSKLRIGTASLLATHCVDSSKVKSLLCPGQLSCSDSVEVGRPLCLHSNARALLPYLALYDTFQHNLRFRALQGIACRAHTA